MGGLPEPTNQSIYEEPDKKHRNKNNKIVYKIKPKIKKKRNNDFAQVIGDDVIVDGMMMNDIVNEMEGIDNKSDFSLMIHRTTEWINIVCII